MKKILKYFLLSVAILLMVVAFLIERYFFTQEDIVEVINAARSEADKLEKETKVAEEVKQEEPKPNE